MKNASLQVFPVRPVALGASALVGALMLTACGGGGGSGDVSPPQPTLGAHVKTILTVEGRQFKDLNANGKLDKYEDWRLCR